ncbi:hypothetical protein ACFQBQ_06430 [Granulicella cerasi]|uniref:Uncharacterized protein n=2 Tax=Granulicella cerasi TaxID=741063 RepID=A0ABW1Z7Q5_9BACT
MNDTTSRAATGKILVCLPMMSTEQTTEIVHYLLHAFDASQLVFAGAQESSDYHSVSYAPARTQLQWVLGASDYLAAAALSQQQQATAVLLLGTDTTTLPLEGLRSMVDTVSSGIDLVVPMYPLEPHDALVTKAIIYPLTRTLFTTDIELALPADVALSPRMLARLAQLARRAQSAGTESLIWPVAEAAIAGYQVRQVAMPHRVLPGPTEADLNALLAAVAGSLFADIEAKASYWQRGRAVLNESTPGTTADQTFPVIDTDEIASMLDAFQLASNNLTELWAIVLPPQSLLAVKKLSRLPAAEFSFDASLWARVVYDFVLAFHARTLNRSHLLGAMTPLYLAWVASYIRAVGDDRERAARQAENVAQAFEREKPYLVARWRWPDRFNP